MNTKQIKHMVDRFLGWHFPEDISPDGGFSYEHHFQHRHMPTGTNLLSAAQAEAMVHHMVEGAPSDDFGWLIEAPGQRYLAARAVAGHKFYWTQDHAAALRFFSEEQADLAMMAIREIEPALFGFAVTLGEARPIEHAWISR